MTDIQIVKKIKDWLECNIENEETIYRGLIEDNKLLLEHINDLLKEKK
jgi:hypothetical protein